MPISRRALVVSGVQCVLALIGAALVGVHHINVALLVLLLVFAVVGDRLEVESPVLTISGAFVALGLSMVLLGPVLAAFVGLVTVVIDSVRRRPPINGIAANLATFLAFPLLGGLLVDAATDGWHLDRGDVNFGLVVVGTFLVANALNFFQIALTHKMTNGRSVIGAARRVYLPILPSQLALGVMAAVMIWAYAHGGGVALAFLLGVVVLYQYMLRELLLSRERAEQLGKRTTQLASLQVGVLTAMLQTLSLRDKMTARHCAAVARYSREMAREFGCDEEQQDLVHTAGLLHDIGKFIFPDSILLGRNKLTDEEYEIVKKHPAQGAKVVRGVDGYGPVADIILAHHERPDGKGYPNGLKGDEVPLLSRMISVADTYDVMTARDSYRDPVSPAEAIAELRRVSGSQLDGELVELFIKILERRGIGFHHGDDADFESEIDLERRIRKYAEPKVAA